MFEKLLQMQQSTFQACLQSFVEATNKRFDNLVRNNAKEIAELRASVQFTQKETDDMKQAMRSQSEQVRANIRGIDAAAAAQREIEDGIDYIENQTRRNILRIDGVIESPAETWADTEAAVRKTLATSLKLSKRHANDIISTDTKYYSDEQFVRDVKSKGDLSFIHFNARSLNKNFQKIKDSLDDLKLYFDIRDMG